MAVAERAPIRGIVRGAGPEVHLNLLNTAGHELNHALVALNYGVPIVRLSLLPDGNSLGRITFRGHIPIPMFQIIAAAGTVDTPFGPARGYLDDMRYVHGLASFYGGVSADLAMLRAGEIISEYPMPLRKRAVEIIASLQNVPGEAIPLVLAQAEAELSGEEPSTPLPSFVEVKPIDMSRGEYSEIVLLPDNSYRLIYIVDGKRIREDNMCGHCRGFNGHKEECLHRRNQY